MTHLQLRLVSFTLLVLAPIVGDAADTTFPLKAKRILIIGDSITYSGGYVAWIETQLRLQGVDPLPEIISIGLSSETCSGLSEPDHPFPRPDVHERLDRALTKLIPDVVVACYGMNDGIYYPFREDRFKAYQDGVNRLIEKVHATKAQLVLMSPTPFDPVPLRDKGKLKPAGEEKYAWFAVYEDYDSVLKRYAQWIMQQADRVEMVIDLHSPLTQYVADKRKKDPQFTVAGDGIHPNAEGQRLMGETILKAWGVESTVEPAPELFKLMTQRVSVLRDAWLSDVGHKRPGVRAGLPIKEATAKVAALDVEIAPLIEQARSVKSSSRKSTGGTIHNVSFVATTQPDELRLGVTYSLWIPDGVQTLRGVIVHQHGCGPGASIGGQTAADDLHWQVLARKWNCALMGSLYEPKRGVNCRLWCDAAMDRTTGSCRLLAGTSTAGWRGHFTPFGVDRTQGMAAAHSRETGRVH